DLIDNEASWSDGLYRLHHLPPETVITRELVMGFCPPEDRERVEKAIEKAILQTGRYDLEHRVLLADGTVKVIQAVGQVVKNETGQPVRMIGICMDISERKIAEERLRQSEQLLAEAQRIARIGSYDWNIASGELRWSDQMYRIFGMIPDGRPLPLPTILGAVSAADRKVFRQAIETALQTTKRIDHVYSLTRADGSKRMTHALGRVFDDESGRPVRMAGTFQDITERWQADEQLRLLSEAVKQSPVCIVITDPAARIQFVNPRFTELTGYRPEEVIGQTPSLLRSGYTPQASYQELWQTITAKEKWRGEFRNKKKNGEFYWEQALIAPICNDAGTITHFMSIKEDITERKAAEEQIRTLSLAIEHSPALVMITDSSGNVEYANPKYSRVTGFSLNELRGRNIGELGIQNPGAREKMWLALAAADEWQGEFRNWKKSGEIFFEAAAISRVKNKEGITTHLVKVSEDITERRALENQLRHVQKMDAIGQFSAGLAHDFNNLLTAIISYASIQHLKAEEGSTLKSDLSGIVDAANRGNKLIQDLLAFSRKRSPESGLKDLAVVDLNALITRGRDLLHRLIGAEIELILQLTPQELPIRANEHHLEQVLMNLVSNASDAMSRRGRLSLATETVTLNQLFLSRHGFGILGRYALLSIADSGCGMEAKVVGRIFEPFFTTKEVNRGTGLGLSITYGIIKQHKGFITCYSRPGRGTIFRIFLPLDEGSRPEPEPALADVPAGGRETILLVQDDETARILARCRLEELGYQIIEAVDCEEALQKFREHRARIGCLLVEAFLLKPAGNTLLSELTAIDPDARVVVCGSYPAEVARQNDPLPPGVVLLPKPFFPSQLLSTLRAVLDRATGGTDGSGKAVAKTTE
ncbi:PAS domain S-box protein, partial [Trichloromonas sp.]|uniref:PAS domain S-box protein n=1 Tax=Trichloromonas sp. TaxID=3069249 RepID=UPI003D814A5E